MISSSLLIQEMFHGVFALPFAYILWKKTKSWKRAVLVVVLTYVMDADHLVDYFLYYGPHFNLFSFLSAQYFVYTMRAIVPFHAWEWALILAVISYKKRWKSLFTILLFALIPHLVFDSITVGSVKFYSIIYRYSRNFTNLN